MRWGDGDYYDGEYFENSKHGPGTYVKATGETYTFTGSYKMDKKHG